MDAKSKKKPKIYPLSKAEKKLMKTRTYPVTRKDGRVVRVTVPDND